MALDREKLIGLARPDVVEVGPVPGLDDTVFLRPLGVKARQEYAAPMLHAHLYDEKLDLEWHVRTRLDLVLRSLADADGNRLFSDDEREYVEEMPIEAFDFIVREVERLNGMSKEAEQEIAGNSTPDPTASTSSD